VVLAAVAQEQQEYRSLLESVALVVQALPVLG
jgi:hypothetical protein